MSDETIRLTGLTGTGRVKGAAVARQLIPEAVAAYHEGKRLLKDLPPLSPDHETVALAVASLRFSVEALRGTRAVSRRTIMDSRATIEGAARTIAQAKVRAHRD